MLCPVFKLQRAQSILGQQRALSVLSDKEGALLIGLGYISERAVPDRIEIIKSALIDLDIPAGLAAVMATVFARAFKIRKKL
jgi:hypothetical protein